MQQNIQSLLPYFVNFSIVVVFLFYVTKKPLKKFLYQRHERMKDEFEAAARAHKRAQERNMVATSAARGVSGQELRVLDDERRGAQEEARELLQRSQQESARIIAEADRLARVEQEEASDRVREIFLDMVVVAAEESLRRGLKRDDHAALLKRAQNSIEVGV